MKVRGITFTRKSAKSFKVDFADFDKNQFQLQWYEEKDPWDDFYFLHTFITYLEEFGKMF